MSKISKTKIIEDIKNLSDITSHDKKITNNKTNECIITIKGYEKDMSNKNDGFTNKQLEQLSQLMDYKLSPIVQRLEKIESRLDVLESLPTIQKELKSKSNK